MGRKLAAGLAGAVAAAALAACATAPASTGGGAAMDDAPLLTADASCDSACLEGLLDAKEK